MTLQPTNIVKALTYYTDLSQEINRLTSPFLDLMTEYCHTTCLSWHFTAAINSNERNVSIS